MRSICWLLLLAASGVQAQTLPDTTNPRRYFPLAVGNTWWYAGVDPAGDGTYVYTRWDIVAALPDPSAPRYVLEQQTVREPRGAPRVSATQRDTVWFDPGLKALVTARGCWRFFTCNLAAVYGGFTPTDSLTSVYVYRSPLTVGTEPYGTVDLKDFSQTASRRAGAVADVGIVWRRFDNVSHELVFAYVNGRAYGSGGVYPYNPFRDPLDASGYFPLAVGNVWEYRHTYYNPLATPSAFSVIERYRVLGSSAVGDTLWYDLHYDRFTEGRALQYSEVHRVRYDPATTSVVESIRGSTGASAVRPYPAFACALGSDTGNGLRNGCWSSVRIRHETVNGLAPLGQPVRVKAFSNFVYSYAAVHGVGVIRGGGGCEPCSVFDSSDGIELIYARIGGQVYGQSVVAVESATGLETDWSLSPNPARGGVRITGAVGAHLGLYDLLGRLLQTVEITERTHWLDLSGVAPGVYAVQAGGKARTLVVQ